MYLRLSVLCVYDSSATAAASAVVTNAVVVLFHHFFFRERFFDATHKHSGRQGYGKNIELLCSNGFGVLI